MTRPTPTTEAEHRRFLHGCRNGLFICLPFWALVILLLAGCAAPMPLTEGPRARLVPGIAEPRSRAEMDIRVHTYGVTAWGKCLELAAGRSPVSAVFSVLTLSPYHACAVVPRDHELRPGQRPWCIVAVPEGDPDLLEHELRHCEGWATPAPPRRRTSTEDRG